MKDFTIKVSGEGDNVLDPDLPVYKTKLNAEKENLREESVILPTTLRKFRAITSWSFSGNKYEKADIGIDHSVGGIPLVLEAEKISEDRYSSLSGGSLDQNRIYTLDNYYCRIFYNKENV